MKFALKKFDATIVCLKNPFEALTFLVSSSRRWIPQTPKWATVIHCLSRHTQQFLYATITTDANPNTDTTEQFQTINKAYHILIDPQKRLKYNSQTCHYGLASDTPHFIMDAFETDTYAQQKKSTADTDAVRYQPMQLEPNDNGRGSLFQKDDKEDQANPYRISSY